MTIRRRIETRHPAGFTLVEMMVVGAIVLVIAAFGFPALQLMLNRSKLQGAAREITVHLGSSRVAAMRLGRNVVVRPLFAEKRLVSFVDDNANFVRDPGEDELANLTLTGIGGDRGVILMGPDGIPGTDSAPGQAMVGLTTHTIGGSPPQIIHCAVFEPDGSIMDEGGGFRISDGKDPANVFWVRIDPPATARIEILKFIYGNVDGLPVDEDPGGTWFGQGGNMWEWY